MITPMDINNNCGANSSLRLINDNSKLINGSSLDNSKKLLELTTPPITFLKKLKFSTQGLFQRRFRLSSFISSHNLFERLSVLAILVLWLYLFLPFRLFDLPVLFGQIEEWTIATVWLSFTGLLLFFSFFKRNGSTFALRFVIAFCCFT